jgi:hypothetical protein
MTNEEFLKDICPNHTDKSKWNKSELLHILDKYQALQLQQTGVIVRSEQFYCWDLAVGEKKCDKQCESCKKDDRQ